MCALYEKGDSENEHWNNHFAMYCAIIVLKYYFLVFKVFKKQINIAIRFFYDPRVRVRVNFVLFLNTIFDRSKFYKHKFCHVTGCANEISLFYIKFQSIFKSVLNFLAL
jgi:hypothetical protein